MVFFTCFSDAFHGNFNGHFSKTYEPSDDRCVKTVRILCLHLSALSKTSLSEKFRAEVFKSPFKTRT